MITITVASAKGGVGKTSLCAALAAHAAKGDKRVALMDLDAGQANLTQWWAARGEPDNPHLAQDIQNIRLDAQRISKLGYGYLFVDTPPVEIDLIEEAIKIADFVLVPLRTSAFDVVSVEAVADLCREHAKPFGFLLSVFDGKAKTLNKQVVYALSEIGPLLKARISYRVAYIHALTTGRTGAEIAKELVTEIDELWAEISSSVECVNV
jgi:chromosome partitioning protein